MHQDPFGGKVPETEKSTRLRTFDRIQRARQAAPLPSMSHKAFPSRSHVAATDQITAALQRGEGFIVATGAPGSGKTTLCLGLRQVADDRTFVATLFDPRFKPEQLVASVLRDFGLIAQGQAATTTAADRDALLATAARFFSSLRLLGARAVVIVDDAEQLSTEALVEFRKLSQSADGEPMPVRIVLVGRASLDTVLTRPELEVVDRAVLTRVRLTALAPDEVLAYVLHRRRDRAGIGADQSPEADLAVARRLTPQAIDLVCERTGGIPALVNDHVARIIDGREEDERVVAEGPAGTPTRTSSWMRRVLVPTFAGATIGLAALGVWFWSNPRTSSVRQTAARAQESTAPQATTAVPIAASPRAAAPLAVPAAPEPLRAIAPEASDAAAPTASASAEWPVSTIGTTGTAATPADGYRITVASFRSPERATDAASALKTLQLARDVVVIHDGKWHQVITGPYPALDQALAAQRALAQAGFPDTVLSAPDGRRLR